MWLLGGHIGAIGMMRQAVRAAAAGLAVTVAITPASAASFDCNAGGLTRTEIMICADTQLSRTDTQLARRVDAAARRLNYGQYLGLRHWQADSALQRNQCGADRACITAHYRAQQRFLDRFQQCLEGRLARRGCLREALSVDRVISGTAGRRGAAGAP
jgi:uncharacterized protein